MDGSRSRHLGAKMGCCHAKGTGLGLSTVFGFARQSGGGLQIESQVGKGTTISLYLPASKSDLAMADQVASKATPHLGSKGLRVLVVEDQPDIRAHVEKLLIRAGYSVASAQDAQTALDILKFDTNYDILFTDVVMPGGINGVQLAAAALNIIPNIKILYTSGFPASAFDEIGVDGGEDLAILSKPFKSAELLHAINQLANA